MRITTVRLMALCVTGLAAFADSAVHAQSPAATIDRPAPPDVHRIVFLGDSITHAGGYIDALETAILVQFPERHVEILNLGLPSETTSGLSEPGHAGGQFPRPDLHERLQRVLEKAQPDLVVACYGMNDGIYYPLSDDRLKKFQDGIERLHAAVEARGARIIHLTPALFDAVPIRARLLPAGRESYPQPYEGYDDVLEAYSAWMLGRRADGWDVLDAHRAMKQALAQKREQNPEFTFAADGVHPNAEGQAVLARPLAAAWGLTLDDRALPSHPHAEEILKLVREKQKVLKLAWLTATGHKRPGIAAGLPVDEAQAAAAALDTQARRLAGFQLLFNGRNLDGWEHQGNWKVEDGVITRSGQGGSLVLTKTPVPDDFELRFEWKVARGSNSGVYYRPGQYEYQILDNVVHADGQNPRTSAASLYFCMQPSEDATKPVGEWNEGRVVCKGTVIQHWLNEKKVIDFDYGNPAWAFNVSLLRDRGGDLAARGAPLSLQDHGDPVWYRGLEMRAIPLNEDINHSNVTPAPISEAVLAKEKEKLDQIVKRREEADAKNKTNRKK